MNRASWVLAGLLAAQVVRPAWAECPEGPWPGEEWPSRTEETAREKAAEIKALEDYAFTLTGADEARKGIRTNGVLIVQDGAVIYERYARGFSGAMPHLTWSCSKTVTNAVVGAAVQRGLLALDDSICKHIRVARTENCRITVRHLLEFSSGLAWKEVYENESNQASSVLAMLYGEGRRDMARFVAGHEARDPPGTTWMYSSGDTTLLAGVASAALRPALGDDFLRLLLFEPLGMKRVTFERDAAGTFVGSSLFFATPRDFARLGWLFLQDGCWKGQRLLPEGWVRESTWPSRAFRQGKRIGANAGEVQGWQIWLNRPVPAGVAAHGLELPPVPRPWPDVPEDAYAARGHWGQSMTMVPSRRMIVVRFGDDREKRVLDFNRFLSLALAVGR